MKIFGHRSIESFRRELSRNSQLRIVCGLSEGKYKYCGKRKHLVPPAKVFTGTTKKEWHYGFRAHIICDAKYGLPIKSKVTPANNSEQTELDNILEEMEEGEKYKLDKMKNLMGDAGYESGVRNRKLKEKYDINAIIDIKHIWDKEEKYKMRTEVERLNGRIDRDYMFNDHFIRGQEKMELMLNLTFIVMLTIAKGHIKNEQKNIRSLVA